MSSTSGRPGYGRSPLPRPPPGGWSYRVEGVGLAGPGHSDTPNYQRRAGGDARRGSGGGPGDAAAAPVASLQAGVRVVDWRRGGYSLGADSWGLVVQSTDSTR